MSIPAVGQVAPSFRLPSGQGSEVGPEDFRGRGNLIVWFTKGMACPFCRQKMSQLARGHPTFRALDAEVLEVTPSTPERARFYVKRFAIPFPYLSDPDSAVRRRWGLDVRSHSLAWYVTRLARGATSPKPSSDFGSFVPRPGEFPALLADDDMGFFILDRDGVVRLAVTGPYVEGGQVRPIPSNEEIARELERCRQR